MIDKKKRLKRRHGRIRKKITGTQERPRLCVRRSLKNIYVQIIDDVNEKTLYSFSTMNSEYLASRAESGKVEAATKLGEIFGARVKEKGITKVAFDRGGYAYHGRVKALAESLRKAGIDF